MDFHINGSPRPGGTGEDRETTIWALSKGNFQEAANKIRTKLSELQVAVGQVRRVGAELFRD